MNLPKLIYIGNELKAHGKNPTTIDTLAPLLRKEGYNVVTASGVQNKPLRLMHMWGVMLKHSASARWLLIDTYSTANFWYAYSAARLARLLGLKYVLILHGGDLPKRLKTNPGQMRWLFKNAAKIIAPSAFLQDRFQKAGINDITFIPNAIPLQEYDYKMRTHIRPKILWVRAFSKIYDPLTAVKTLELLLKNHKDAELCMVGPIKDDSYEECLRYVKKNELPVTFKGILTKKEWHRLSENYDVFLNTSIIDNTPVSIIEAMALGFPVVTSNVGGIPYLLQEQSTGFLVDNGNPQAMANAVEVLLSNSELTQTMSISAREKAQKFDWSLVKEQWSQILS